MSEILLLLFIFTLGLVGFNVYRSQQKQDFSLQPNCLITRSPIVFINGTQSLFYFLNYWNWIPTFLKEHGYEVYYLRLPWRKIESRKVTLHTYLKNLKNNHQQIHLFLDTSSENDFKDLLGQHREAIKSLTVLETSSKKKGSQKINSIDLNPAFHSFPVYRYSVAKANKHSLRSRLSQILIFFHNTFYTPQNPLQAAVLGVDKLSNQPTLSQTILNAAILLAESDLQR